jgi:hypothetical protein
MNGLGIVLWGLAMKVTLAIRNGLGAVPPAPGALGRSRMSATRDRD